MDPVELDGAEGVDEVAEHAGAADGGELHRVADRGRGASRGGRPGRSARRGVGSATMAASSTMTVVPAGRS